MLHMKRFVTCMMVSYGINERNAPVLGGLSCVSPNMTYSYKDLLIYSSLIIVSSQPAGRTIQHVAELFQHLMHILLTMVSLFFFIILLIGQSRNSQLMSLATVTSAASSFRSWGVCSLQPS